MKKDCIFCSIVKENKPFHEIVWRDKKHIAFLNIKPVTRVHVLLIPKKHYEHVLLMNKKDYVDFMLASRKLALHLKKIFKTKRVAIFLTGLSINHVHAHLSPMNTEGELGTFMSRNVTPRQQASMAKKIRG